MAKMRIGRTTPLTTDPVTGARIANPEKMGGRLSGDGFDREISSWPVVREAYKSGKYGFRKFTGTEFKYDPRVEKYLKGETNILSEDIDEPMIVKRTNPATGENVMDLHERYKPGGPTYNKIISRIQTERRPKKGEVANFSTTQYESALSKSGSNSYNQATAEGPNYVESFTPGARKTKPAVKAKTPITVAPKVIPTNIKKVAVTTPTNTPTAKSKPTVAATPKEDMTIPSRMAIKKPGLIKTEKQELQGELEKRPEYTQISSTRRNILPTKGGRYNIHTPIGAKVVQALTGYNKKGGYQEGEGRIFGDRIRTTDKDRSYNIIETDESGRAIFKGAEGLKDLRAQKKYNKEFDKYQAKQDQMKAYSSMFNNAANRNTIESQISKLKKP